MDEGRPSSTALSAAAARAAHPLVDERPLIFTDPLAGRLLGGLADEMIAYHRGNGGHIILAGTRTITTVRSRYAEARTGAFGQYAVLGAGLDTYAFRAPAGKRVFEVDHPATQEWKKGLLDAAGIPIPGNAALVPVDFEEPGGPVRRLAAAGFDTTRPALVSWLGVSYFLTRDAIAGTLAEIGRLAPGTELVMDYALPPGLRDAEGDAYAEIAARVTRDAGEPSRSRFAPDEVNALLAEHGLDVVENVTLERAVPPEAWRRTDALRPFDYFRLLRAVVR
ncbi:class I SAM-dependent methyltransferase [Actinomadura montaniterrae]|uniref:S-adenosyl-L-methionine-dependent methyltransferase n=1 Tax=Actinomadura montaniterrae TaxID=1803903 RepID=A0A6L3VLF6_9ACTN|nr:SAM-dependent methyltransferase [Actinomadura montaniterrae]KAB2370782.1 class I SAM-dependent methyltransferase [Actinomadura montaniterrae]